MSIVLCVVRLLILISSIIKYQIYDFIIEMDERIYAAYPKAYQTSGIVKTDNISFIFTYTILILTQHISANFWKFTCHSSLVY